MENQPPSSSKRKARRKILNSLKMSWIAMDGKGRGLFAGGAGGQGTLKCFASLRFEIRF